MARPRFDPKRALIAARAFPYLGVAYKAGEPFPGLDGQGNPPPGFKLRTLYGSRLVDHGEGTAAEAGPPADADQVTIEAQPGGFYLISAPWLDESERIKGKVKAERRAAALREDGEPDYHHGVRVEEGENGWWSVQADWTGDNEYNIHGEEAAREQAAKLRSEGPPPDPRTEVTIEDAGDDLFLVNAPWLEGPIEATGRETADAEAQRLREAGPPEGWEPAPAAE